MSESIYSNGMIDKPPINKVDDSDIYIGFDDDTPYPKPPPFDYLIHESPLPAPASKPKEETPLVVEDDKDEEDDIAYAFKEESKEEKIPQYEATKNFSINRFFNNLPIRIIGSANYPIFYLHEVCDILAVGHQRNVHRDVIAKLLDPEDIVSQQQLEDLGIETYSVNGKIHANAITINERGMYSLLYASRTRIGANFRRFVYDLLYEIRTKEEEKLKVIGEKLLIKNNKFREHIYQMNEDRLSLENFVDKIIVFQIRVDPTLINDYRSFHKEDRIEEEDPNYTWVDDDVNRIDNYQAFARGHPKLAVELASCFKLTEKPSALDQLTYTHRYTLFCKDAKKVLAEVDAKLSRYKTAKYHQHIFRCDFKFIEDVLGKYVVKHSSDYRPIPGKQAKLLRAKKMEVNQDEIDFHGFDQFTE